LWKTIQPPSAQRHLEAVLGKQHALALATGLRAANDIEDHIRFDTNGDLELVDDDFEGHLDDKAIRTWGHHFNDNPHSDTALLDLLPAAIEAATKASQE
jgi:hypothetical protein